MMSICKNLTYRPQNTDPITPSIRAADVMPFTVDAAADAVTENPSSPSVVCVQLNRISQTNIQHLSDLVSNTNINLILII